MLRLKCVAQSYAWGRSATDSEVAQLAIADGASIDDQKPYAELWMGTHPSGPSMLAANGQSLKGWLLANPQALGDAVIKHFGTDLPFLFKVLSVRTALSIQSHPDKALAKQLHAERPEVYKDGNHKPEMALALTAFKALCGFVEHEELVRALAQNPELREVIGEVNAALLASAWDDSLKKEGLRAAFTALMTADAATVSAAIDRLTVRLQAASQQRSLSPKEALLLRLNQQYPQDVGVLSVFFLNLVSLPAGDAIYLAANQPHAYLAGELMEVMATSDNVLRAGLTPKLRDTGVLCSSLTYSQGFPEVLHGTPAGPHVRMYSPPFEEFELAAISLPAGESMTLAANPGPQLLMVQHGSGAAAAKSPPGVGFGDGNELQQRTDLTRGQVWFIPANTAIELSTPVSSTEPLFMWSAACNAIVFSQIAAPEVEAIPSRIREKVLTLV